jgi:hypothetical protein
MSAELGEPPSSSSITLCRLWGAPNEQSKPDFDHGRRTLIVNTPALGLIPYWLAASLRNLDFQHEALSTSAIVFTFGVLTAAWRLHHVRSQLPTSIAQHPPQSRFRVEKKPLTRGFSLRPSPTETAVNWAESPMLRSSPPRVLITVASPKKVTV